jgi:hypothetical protein
MEFAIAIRRLLRHKLLIALGIVVAGIVGIMSVYRLQGGHLVAKEGVVHSTASTQVLVDAPSSALADLATQSAPLQSLATTLANFAPTTAVLDLISKAAGLEPGQLSAEGPVSSDLPRTVQEPTNLERNVQITGEVDPYRLQFNADPNLPEIGIYAQAPNTAEAIKLANAAATGLTAYLIQLQQSGKVSANNRVVLRQLGQATGGVDAPNASKSLGAMAFVAVFAVWCVLILVTERLLEIWRASARYAPPQRRRLLRHVSRRKPATADAAERGSELPADPDDELERAFKGNGFADDLDHARLASVVGPAQTADAID